jgi:ParB-like chromosome segregation protein Spo0J
MSNPLDIRILPLADLKPAPYNPRQSLRPADRRYRKLAASLREFGLVEPLIWNELTGHVVGGHARLAILTEMGVTDVPVSVVRLTPEREKALNVVTFWILSAPTKYRLPTGREAKRTAHWLATG